MVRVQQAQVELVLVQEVKKVLEGLMAEIQMQVTMAEAAAVVLITFVVLVLHTIEEAMEAVELSVFFGQEIQEHSPQHV
jgi:hypothetical protein